MKKYYKSILFLCLFLFGAVSCNTTQQPAKKQSQPAKQGQPACPKEDSCDPCS